MSAEPARFIPSPTGSLPHTTAWQSADYVRTATIDLTSKPLQELVGAALKQLGCPIGIPEEEFVARLLDRLRTGNREPLLGDHEIDARRTTDMSISFQDHITTHGGMRTSQVSICIDMHAMPALLSAGQEGGTRCKIFFRDGQPLATFDFEHQCSSSQRERFGALLVAYATACGGLALPELRSWMGAKDIDALPGISLRTY